MATDQPVDIIRNLEKFINSIVKNILRFFPLLVGVLTFILFAILALLLFIFQGGNMITP
ncbi:MAG TPA: hypothetical protein PLS49_04240 [Candidatus Woesebacteria bacterium]|nr:hypothetical protein [Candidatus Woesebacteria bacterium]